MIDKDLVWQRVGRKPALLRSPATYWTAAYPGPAGLVKTALSDGAVDRAVEWLGQQLVTAHA